MSTTVPAPEDLFVVRKPRVWTALLAILVVPVLAGLLGIIPLAAYEAIAWGGHVGRIVDAISRPPETGPEALVLFASTYFATVLLVARFAALSPTSSSVRERLELLAPRMRSWGWFAIPIGSLGVAGCVGYALEAMGVEGFDAPMLEPLLGLRGAWAVALVVWVCLLGPFTEEMLFRGYVQTRLVQRWGPIVGIAIASTTFGLGHASSWDMLKAVSVIPIGVWLGWVAWRTRSMITSTVAHVTINAAGTALAAVYGVDDHLTAGLAILACGVSLALLIVAWRVMRVSTEPQAPIEPAVELAS